MWGKIHGFDKLKQKRKRNAETDDAAIIIAATCNHPNHLCFGACVKSEPENPYKMAFWMWLGFMLPVQVSAVVLAARSRVGS